MEQYFRPAIACVTPDTMGRTALFHVQQPSVRVNVEPEPPQVSAAETGPDGRVAYAPGSVTAVIDETLPPEIVAVNFAGELVVV